MSAKVKCDGPTAFTLRQSDTMLEIWMDTEKGEVHLSVQGKAM